MDAHRRLQQETISYNSFQYLKKKLLDYRIIDSTKIAHLLFTPLSMIIALSSSGEGATPKSSTNNLTKPVTVSACIISAWPTQIPPGLIS